MYEFIKKYYFIIFCAVSMALPDVLLRMCVSPGVFDGFDVTMFSLIFSLGWIFILVFLCVAVLPGKWGRAVFCVTNTLFIILAFCEYVYFRIFDQFFWLSSIGLATEGSEYLGYAVRSIDATLIGCTVMAMLFMIAGVVLWKPIILSRRKKYVISLIPVALLLLAHISMQPQIRGESVGGWDMWRKPGVVYTRFSDINKSIEICGLYHFTFRNASHVVTPNTTCSAEDFENVDSCFAQMEEVDTNPYTGMFAGKNVIAVMMESIDTWMIDPVHTPTLYHMMNTGINFTNYNAPFFGTGFTFSSEFAFNTGLYTPSSSVSASSFGRNTFPYALARLFSQAGYSTNSFHFNSREFYNRGIMHRSFGYEKYHSLDDFGISGTEAELDSNMMENDELYRKMTEKTPFFNFVITYSAHLPYTDDSPKLQLAKEYHSQFIDENEHPELNNIQILAADTDEFFRQLLERLDEDNLLRDTVIVAYTDHYAYGVSDESLLSSWKGDTLKYTVPAFIYAKGIKPERITKPMMTVDWAPTLVNLFGLNRDSRYLGGDVLDPDNSGFVYFETLDWMDSQMHYIQGEKHASEQNLAKIVENNRKVRERIEINDTIVTGDYYKSR